MVSWKDGSEPWIHLKDLKESNPVELSEFANVLCIASRSTFVWWVHYTLKKHGIILLAMKSRLRKTTHKYGIEIPASIFHVEKIDTKTDNHF